MLPQAALRTIDNITGEIIFLVIIMSIFNKIREINNNSMIVIIMIDNFDDLSIESLLCGRLLNAPNVSKIYLYNPNINNYLSIDCPEIPELSNLLCNKVKIATNPSLINANVLISTNKDDQNNFENVPNHFIIDKNLNCADLSKYKDTKVIGGDNDETSLKVIKLTKNFNMYK